MKYFSLLAATFVIYFLLGAEAKANTSFSELPSINGSLHYSEISNTGSTPAFSISHLPIDFHLFLAPQKLELPEHSPLVLFSAAFLKTDCTKYQYLKTGLSPPFFRS